MVQNKGRKGEVRCLNCFERFEPPERAFQAACPKCQVEWRLSWLSPTSVKVRGPMWDSLKQAGKR